MDAMSFTCALVIILAVSFFSTLVEGRPHPQAGRALHHNVNSEYFSSEESDSSEESSHDLIVKLLDMLNALPLDKLNELDALLTRVESSQELEMPQADMPGPSGALPFEDAVDEEQTIAKDLPADSKLDAYRGPVLYLSDTNVSLAANISGVDMMRQSGNGTVDSQRDRNLQLKAIKNKFLGYFQSTGRKPGNWSEATPKHREILQEVLKKVSDLSSIPDSSAATALTAEDSAEKTQGFYPSCNLPAEIDEDLWSGGKVMNLAFDISHIAAFNGTSTYVTAAKLRLYKLSLVNSSMTLCSPVANDDPKTVKFCSVRIGESSNPASDEKRFRVSIFRYSKPLNKKHKMKRKLLDSGMVSMRGELWTEWDVKGAVKAWKESKNFGLAVKVEDEDGTTLPADRYFVSMNCSKDARAMKPMPGFVLEAARELAANKSLEWSLGEGEEGTLHFFPMLEVSTSQMSEEQQLKLSLEESLKHINSSSMAVLQAAEDSGGAGFVKISVSNLREQHKIRHQNKRTLPDPTDGRQRLQQG